MIAKTNVHNANRRLRRFVNFDGEATAVLAPQEVNGEQSILHGERPEQQQVVEERGKVHYRPCDVVAEFGCREARRRTIGVSG